MGCAFCNYFVVSLACIGNYIDQSYLCIGFVHPAAKLIFLAAAGWPTHLQDARATKRALFPGTEYKP
jgi:hypothetical protein